jgi:hypothetical protein
MSSTDLQELITRGRFIISRYPHCLEVFRLVNGKKNTKEIASASGKKLVPTLQDLKRLKDSGLIQSKISDGRTLEKDGCAVYEKVPILNHVPMGYFESNSRGRLDTAKEEELNKGAKKIGIPSLSVPSETELLDVCRQGEDQLHEFKEPRVETEKITKEIAAFLHTKRGGLIFYGVADDGSIVGSDRRRQDLDQSLQNSIRTTISPQPSIEIKEREVIGQSILVIVTPPWDRKTLYQYTKDSRFYIRRGTNVFSLKPEEISKLGKGEYVV